MVFEVRLGHELAELLVLAPRRAYEMLHAYRRIVRGREERPRQRDIANVATGQLELASQKRQIGVGSDRRLRRQRPPPDLESFGFLWQRKLEHAVEAANERFVDIAAQVRGQHGQAFVVLESL